MTESVKFSDFPEWPNFYIKAYETSKNEVSKRAGVSSATVINISNYKAPYSKSMVLKIADAITTLADAETDKDAMVKTALEVAGFVSDRNTVTGDESILQLRKGQTVRVHGEPFDLTPELLERIEFEAKLLKRGNQEG